MQKILIVGPAWVGDMMMSHVLIQLLKQQYPQSEIDVLAPAWSQALLSRMPEVSQAIVLPFQHGEFKLLERYHFAKTLRHQKYDMAIVLPNSLKSAFIPFFAKIPLRRGYVGEYRYGLLNECYRLDKKALRLMIDRFAALAYPKHAKLAANLPVPYLIVNAADQERALEKHELSTEKRILALCPGAEYGPSKCWPPEYYAAVAKQKIQDGWAVWIFGSKNDIETAEKIQAGCDNRCMNLAGKTSLSEAIDLLPLAEVVVTNDSGLMHLACALDRRVIVLYGSTSVDFTPPLSDYATVLKLSLPCQPCFERVCPLKHHRCMRDLLPEKVLNLF